MERLIGCKTAFAWDRLDISVKKGKGKMETKEIRKWVLSLEGQQETIRLVESLRQSLGSRELWKEALIRAENRITDFTEAEAIALFDRFEPLVEMLPPGHDRGHYLRDLLTSILLFNRTDAKYISDRMAGMLAGAFHDIGNAVMPRYKDREFGAGHAEVGAYIFYEFSKGLLEDNLRMLTAYSIAAHTHYLKPMEAKIPEGYVREPYFDDLWQEDGELVGVAYRITRLSDRTDTNGITLIVRHILSQFDAIEQGGSDLSGDQWFEINKDALKLVVSPYIRKAAGKPPTTLEHAATFANSNHGNSVYSKDDGNFPAFERLLELKLSQLHETELSLEDEWTPFLYEFGIQELFSRMSLADPERLEKAMQVFRVEWEELSQKDKARWRRCFYTISQQYEELLDYYRYSETGIFSNLAKRARRQLKQI